jgi:hypothetical protein
MAPLVRASIAVHNMMEGWRHFYLSTAAKRRDAGSMRVRIGGDTASRYEGVHDGGAVRGI